MSKEHTATVQLTAAEERKIAQQAKKRLEEDQRRQREYKLQLEKQRKIVEERKRKAEEKQRKIAEERRRKAEEKGRLEKERLKKEGIIAKKTTLQQYKNQQKEFDKLTSKAAQLEKLKHTQGEKLREQAALLTTSKDELNQIKEALDSNNRQLDILAQKQKTLNIKIDELMEDISETKEGAAKAKRAWQSELNESRKQLSLARDLKIEANRFDAQTLNFIKQTAKSINEVNKEENILMEQTTKASDLQKKYDSISNEIALLTANPALASSAFITMNSLQKMGYELKEVLSGDKLKAFFEHVNGKHKIEVKLSPTLDEETEWIEELETFGFKGDACLQEIDNYMEKLEDFGVRYRDTSQKYPKPDSISNKQAKTKKPDWVRRKETN